MKIFIANSGVHPELQMVAHHAVARGHELDYQTTLNWTVDSRIASLVQRLPLPASTSALFSKRLLPAEIRKRHLVLHAGWTEIVRQILTHCGANTSVSRALINSRNHRFGRSVAASLQPSHEVVLAQLGTGQLLAEKARALDLPVVLNCPAAHPTAQAEAMPPRCVAQIDAELSLASHVIVASKYSQASYVNAGVSPERISVVPLGCRVHEEGEGHAVKRRVEPDGKHIILYVGRVSRAKGVDLLVDAFDRVRRSLSASLVLVGEVIDRDVAKAATDSGAQIVGPLSSDDTQRYIRNSTCVVMPTRSDGFGLAGLEAMCAAVPLVASDASFASDVIRHGIDGMVFPAGDADSLELCLSSLLRASPSERMAMGEMGSRATSHLTWSRHADAVIDILRNARVKP